MVEKLGEAEIKFLFHSKNVGSSKASCLVNSLDEPETIVRIKA